MSNDENKNMIADMVEVLSTLTHDELLQAYGFALGLQAKQNAA